MEFEGYVCALQEVIHFSLKIAFIIVSYFWL